MEDYIPYLRSMIGHQKCMAIGVTALVVNQKDEILLEKRSDNGLYCLPGGALDYEEKILHGVERELQEETGLLLHDFHLFMIESGPETTFYYPNQDVTNYVGFVFYAKTQEANLPSSHDKESSQVFFCPLKELPPKAKTLPGTIRILEKYLANDFSPSID